MQSPRNIPNAPDNPEDSPASPSRPPAVHKQGLAPDRIAAIFRLLILGWKVYAVAHEVQVAPKTVYRLQDNLLRYGSVKKPGFRALGRAMKLSRADEDALLEHLLQEGWRQQAEMVWWLYHERGILVSQPTVSRLLSRRQWSRKALKQISRNRSEALRRSYLDNIRHFAAEELVFLNKSIFNKKSGWRYHGFAPIGDEARYEANITRGSTWAICSAITLDGWLPCTGVREGYFNADDFFKWLRDSLIPALQVKQHPMVIILDNISIHIQSRVTELVKAAGHLIQFLPPYSPDYNPIELTFSVLKAWMKVNWIFLRQACNSFGDFLYTTIRESRCDRFAKQQFKHSGGRGVYIQEKELARFTRYMEAFKEQEEGSEASKCLQEIELSF